MFSFELEFLKFLEGIRTDFLDVLFQGITILGEETLMVLLVVALWFAFDKREAQKVLFITAGSLCLNGVIKNLVKMPRPFTRGISCVRVETATGYSFPSGHTQGFATWSSLFAIKSKKIWLRALIGVLIVLVGLSRMYLGVHYPSDVVAAIVLGVGISIAGNALFNKIQDTGKIYLAAVIVFSPFFVYFLFKPELLFADFYKTFGMIAGLTLISFLDNKAEPLSYDVSWWKKLLRIIIGIVIAFALKEGIKALNVFDMLQIALVFDALRYFIVVFAVGFLCPIIFKKIKL